MASLLISTPRALLRYCFETEKTYLLETGYPSYYGISWFANRQGLVVSHSGIAPEDKNCMVDYMASEVGWLDYGEQRSPLFLSDPHQATCLEYPYIAATNTGRNAISIVNCEDWSIRTLRFDDVKWDRFDPSGSHGSHFNSISTDSKGRLHILAHNFDYGSYELILSPTYFSVVDRFQYSRCQLHNVWEVDEQTRLACASKDSALVNLVTEDVLWSPEEKTYTRGLAATETEIYIGASEIKPRDERDMGETVFYVLDRKTYATKRRVNVGDFGAICEIRGLDFEDLCHRKPPYTGADLLVGVPANTIPPEVNTPSPEKQPELNQEWRLKLDRMDALKERDAAMAQRDEAMVQYARVVQERDAAMAQRDEAVAQRDEAMVQYARVVQERDAAMAQRDEAVAQQGRLTLESNEHSSHFLCRLSKPFRKIASKLAQRTGS